MFSRMRKKVEDLQRNMRERNVDIALITDVDSVFYFTGFRDYLGMDFGRPVFVIVPQEGEVSLVLPSMELEMCETMTWVKRLLPWADGVGEEWRSHLQDTLGSSRKIVGLECDKTNPVLAAYLREVHPNAVMEDMREFISRQRMIKSPEEIETMRGAGQVAVAMCEAARDAIAVGVAEYEVAFAAIQAGTKKAASLLLTDRDNQGNAFSPLVHDLQILQTGSSMHMVHKRAGIRKIERGDSVYMCFCNLAEFKRMKVGFDRQFYVGSCTDEEARVYEQAIHAQKIALDMICPGVKASKVHEATAQYYALLGYETCYRTGRAVGYSRLEKPEIRADDDTVLEEGMTFAIDGAISLSGGIAGRVGDSIVVTKDGYEWLTPMDKTIGIL